MAIAKVTLICANCGNEFVHRKECWNRTDADNYENWATTHIDTCPECYKKSLAAEKESILFDTLKTCGYKLPNLSGVSDKQIAYAEKVRARYLSNNIERIMAYHEGMEQTKDPAYMIAFAAECKKHGLTIEDGLMQSIKDAHLDTVHLLLTCESAKEILDHVNR